MCAILPRIVVVGDREVSRHGKTSDRAILGCSQSQLGFPAHVVEFLKIRDCIADYSLVYIVSSEARLFPLSNVSRTCQSARFSDEMVEVAAYLY